MVSEAQKRAKKKWDDKNKDKNRVYRYRSYARKFIRDLADEDDLKELEELIHKRVNEQGDGNLATVFYFALIIPVKLFGVGWQQKMGITSQVNCEEVIPMNSLNFTLLILLLILIEVKK